MQLFNIKSWPAGMPTKTLWKEHEQVKQTAAVLLADLDSLKAESRQIIASLTNENLRLVGAYLLPSFLQSWSSSHLNGRYLLAT